MLYIDIISDNSVRFGDAAGGGELPRYVPITLESMKDEIESIWIWNTESDAYVLNCYEVGGINLAGTIYSTAEEFVVAFNGSINTFGTTTTTTPLTTTTTTTTPLTTTTTTTTPLTTTTTTTVIDTLQEKAIVWCDLEEASGNTLVDATGSHNGTIGSGVTIGVTTGKGKGHTFSNSSNNQDEIPDHNDLTFGNEFAIAGSFNVDNVSSARYMLYKANEYMLYHHPGGSVVFRMYKDGGSSYFDIYTTDSVVVGSEFYLVINVTDAATEFGGYEMWIDGVEVDITTSNNPGTFGNTGNDVIIGSLDGYGWYNGTIGQLILFDEALTESEIVELDAGRKY